MTVDKQYKMALKTRNTRCLFLPVLYILVLIAGCNKHNEIPTQSTYTFTNTTDKGINLVFYGSLTDYGSDTNSLSRYFIKPGSSEKMLLSIGRKYWIDWYSDDDAYNNWQTDYSHAAPERILNIAVENDSRQISIVHRDTLKSVLLNGALSSRWKGIIGTGSAKDRIYEFLFRKDMTGQFTYTDLNGMSSTEPLTFSATSVVYDPLGQTRRFLIYAVGLKPEDEYALTCAFSHNSPITGRDSLEVTLHDTTIHAFFVMRQ